MGVIEQLRAAVSKDRSLDDQASEVRRAWSQGYSSPQSETWVREVYDDYVIVCAGQDDYRVPYAKNADGDVTFDVESATEVEQTWTEVTKTVVIAKTDPERQIAFGWAYVSKRTDGTDVTDHSGEFVDDPAVLEDAAYLFNLDYREGDEGHTETVKAMLVESLVVTKEKLDAWGLDEKQLPLGWWTGWYIEDAEMFAKVKRGELPMLSIGGFAERETVDA